MMKVGGRRIKLRYITQSNARPPTFIIFCSRPEDLPEAYVRYLVNGLRESFDLWSVPIRLHLRKPKNPYDDKGGRR
jgi:GTP-binding protein